MFFLGGELFLLFPAYDFVGSGATFLQFKKSYPGMPYAMSKLYKFDKNFSCTSSNELNSLSDPRVQARDVSSLPSSFFSYYAEN